MKFKIREVYTVVRPAGTHARKDINSRLACLSDETGEYLYGGAGPEKIEAHIEYWDTAHKRWIKWSGE